MSAVTTATIVQACSGPVAPSTMSAIVLTESSGWPWSIWDNTANRRYTLPSRAAAVAVASRLIAEGHKLDMGLAQVDSEWLPKLHMTVNQVFSPCRNVRTGAWILSGDYRGALSHGYQGGNALTAAIEAYNSGQYSGDYGYYKAVLRQAHAPVPSGQPVAFTVPAMGASPNALPQSPYTASMVVAIPKPPAAMTAPAPERVHFMIRFP